jgi:small-conductance mechanosensitive channel
MPTKEELEEINDQVLAENQTLREQLAKLSTAAEERERLEIENERLYSQLQQSERERTHAAQMLQSLSAAQASMEKLFQAKEDAALQRLEIEAKKVADERERVNKYRGELKEWGATMEAENTKLKEQAKNAESVSVSTRKALQESNQLAKRLDTERFNAITDLQTKFDQERIAYKAKIAALERIPEWYKVMNWFGEHPSFWVSVLALVLILWTVIWYVHPVRG